MISFIEHKRPNMLRVQELLESCAARNQWANCGPLWEALSMAYAQHIGLSDDRCLIPCANGGVALEAMARLWALRLGRPLRWAVCSFSFRNLGRGWFCGGPVVDCDAEGLMDVAALASLDPDSFDGVVAVNPIGLARDFTPVIRFAQERRLPLLLDNASGMGTRVPDWDWQAFSLHHTKPYGMGEGGLMLVPQEAGAEVLRLITYGDTPSDPALWQNNGKLSDISCAFLLDRLMESPVWLADSATQKARVLALAAEFGLSPLAGGGLGEVPLTSVALLAHQPIGMAALKRTRHFTPAKYYQPLAPTPLASDIFARLVNVPVHPTMARLDDAAIRDDLARLVAG